MNIISFYDNAIKTTLKNSSINLSEDKKIIFCKFNYANQELRVSLNLTNSNRRIYIYFVNKGFDFKDFYNILEKNISEVGIFNNRVYCIENNALSDDHFFNIYLNCLKHIDFVISSQLSNFHPICGDSLDSNNNCIKLIDGVSNCEVKFLGENNQLYIGKNKNLKGLKIEFVGNNSHITLGSNLAIGGLIRIGHNCRINFNDRVTSTSNIFLSCAENTTIDIGEDVMFATNNQIRTDDAHPIYCSKTGKRVNVSRNIKVGKHVWLGFNAILLGGTEIGDGSVIAAGAIVKNKFPNNCIIGGVPAKIIKRDIFWQRNQTLHFDQTEGKSIENFYDLDYVNVTISNELI